MSHAMRWLWTVAGVASLALGIAGIVLPLVPTVPFVLLAAWCFSRGCERCERWLLGHPRLGPPLRDWRAHHAVPRRVKWLASALMLCSATFAWWLAPPPWHWLPAAFCAVAALWLWRLPDAAPRR